MWLRDWQLIAATVISSLLVLVLLFLRHLSSRRTWETGSVADQLQERLQTATEATPHVVARFVDAVSAATEPVKETLGIIPRATADTVIGEDDPSDDEQDGIEGTAGGAALVSRTPRLHTGSSQQR